MFSGFLFIHLFVCYQICEHGIFKTYEPLMMQINTRDSRGNFGDQWAKRSRSNQAKIGHKNRFISDISQIVSHEI